MDANFIFRQLQEKYLTNKKDLWMAFVDLEKAFDSSSRDGLVGMGTVIFRMWMNG